MRTTHLPGHGGARQEGQPGREERLGTLDDLRLVERASAEREKKGSSQEEEDAIGDLGRKGHE